MAGTRYSDSEVRQLEESCICGGQAKILYAETERVVENEYTDEFEIHVLKVIKCQQCKKSSVIKYVGFGREGIDDQDEWRNEPPGRIYYRKLLLTPKRIYDSSIPWQIIGILNEAYAVLASSPRACIGLCRSVLEEVCSDFDIPKHKENGKFHYLSERLKILASRVNQGVMLDEIIEGIKELGNESTHGQYEDLSRRLRHDDGESVLELVEYVLDRLYVAPELERKAKGKLDALSNKLLSTEKVDANRS